jgi:hypothetical protein
MGGHKSEQHTTENLGGYQVQFREYAKSWWHYEDNKGREWVKKFSDTQSAKLFANNLVQTNLILAGL